jgi:hypothetical protein
MKWLLMWLTGRCLGTADVFVNQSSLASAQVCEKAGCQRAQLDHLPLVRILPFSI